MPNRNLIPLALLAVLAVLALLFAVFGARSAPSGATLTVQNASGQTFGTPTGSTSFSMDVVNTVADTGGGTASQVRLVRYVPPSRMAAYQVVGTQAKLLAVLNPAAVTCTLRVYTAIVGGATPWTATGTAFTRTETLADYAARVPQASSGSCEPVETPVDGQVHERATVRSGYLVGVHLSVAVPQQTIDGHPVPRGVENQALVMLEIDGTRTRTLSP